MLFVVNIFFLKQLRNATYPTELYVKSHHGGESVGPTYVGTVGTYVIGWQAEQMESDLAILRCKLFMYSDSSRFSPRQIIWFGDSLSQLFFLIDYFYLYALPIQ